MEILIAGLLWLATFPVAWLMLPRIMFDKVHDYKLGLLSWTAMRLAYIFIIVLPYLPLLAYPQLERRLRWAVYSLLVIMLVSTVIRLFYRERFKTVLWSAYAFVYDGLLSFSPYRNLLNSMAQLTLEKKPITSVLNLGCGTGNLDKILLESNNEISRLVCVDSSTNMLGSAKKKIQDRRIEFIHEDINKYLSTSKPEQHDVVIAMNSLYTQKNKQNILSLIRTVLRPGGILVMTDPVRGGNMSLIMDHLKNDTWLKLLLPRLIAVWVVDNFISQLSERGDFAFSSKRQWESMLEESGFKVQGDIQSAYGGANIILTAKVE